ncbi:hypothetical protein MTR_0389s0010 [Medicago truncatula]|uniref:Uncharacterized protein n=1 Tax=Medicago truncatula TaxID=3880 RepID=A0A072TR14_MEDTR|nr:hypothetical protein MTR_0389s0010 [Medicago truncatula]
MNVVGMGVLPSPDKYSEVVKDFGNLVEPVIQTLVQTGKMERLEQEVHELRGEVTTLRAEVEKLTSLVSSLMATNDPPLVQQRPQSPYQPVCSQKPRQQAPRQSISQNQVP